MRAKPPSRTSRNNRTVNKSRSKPSEKKMENGGTKPPQSTDLAVLRQPIDTSISGLRQACKLLETGTPEMLHILSYECDIVYECKVCRNLFRSLANLISHKRVYCTNNYSSSQNLLSANQQVEDHTVIVESKNTMVNRPARITARRDLTSIVETVASKVTASQFYTEAANKVSARNLARKETTVHLQPMENTSYGVFQTVVNSPSKDLMKNQVTELHSLLDEEENIPTLGPDGRILTNGNLEMMAEENNKHQISGLICPKCNVKFSVRRTLNQHMKTVHESVRTCFSCPCCKKLFANTWSVYRHLYKIHRKTNEQVRKLRTQIQKKEVKIEKNETNENQNKVIPSQTEQHRLEEENKAWMEHFEDDFELQRCGGCGRRFERKAALTSHSQICQKRIAACNRIQKEPNSPSKHLPVSMQPTKPVMPKIQNEKKIGIQVRMNYCKTASFSTPVNEGRRGSRIIGDESDIEAASVDGKYAPSSHSSVKESFELRSSSSIDNFFQMQKNIETTGSIDKVKVYLNNVMPNIANRRKTDDIHCNSDLTKVGKLEAKCLQLRKALEVDVNDVPETSSKIEENMSPKNMSCELQDESISIISSNSNSLVPDIELDPSPSILQTTQLPEADSNSISSDGSIEIVYEKRPNGSVVKNSNMYNGSNLHSSKEAEVPTLITDEEIQITTDEISEESGSSKENLSEPILSDHKNQNNSVKENDFILENTISILTRNQLKAICKDDIQVSQTQVTNNQNNNSVKQNGKEYNRISSYINKKLLKYIRVRRLQCLICLKRFRTLSKLRNHVAEHADWKRFRCLGPDCSFSCFSKSDCISHLIKMHLKPEEKDLAATLVGEISPSEWKLNFNFNKTFPVGSFKSSNVRNSARLKSKSVYSNENKLIVEKNLKTGHTVNDITSKKRRIEESDDKIRPATYVTIRGSRQNSNSPVVRTVNVNMMANSKPDDTSAEEGVIKIDVDDSKTNDLPTDTNKSDIQDLVMEVIFGTSTSVTNSSLLSGRPVRNKVRPKRDNDFIYENHKDDSNNSRNGPVRKSNRIVSPKTDSETSKKSK